MKQRESGFSLLELMIALAIVGFVLAAASTFFIGVVRQYKVQSKITESNVEGVVGLELMRQDIESLGFGLPWDMSMSSYTEPGPLPGSSTDPPRAVGSFSTTDNTDYLILRSARVGMAGAAGKWTTLRSGPTVRNWGPADDDLGPNDQVIVISPGGVNRPSRLLLTPQAGATFGVNGAGLSTYVPADSFQTNIVYGIHNVTPLKRPFNRADYYIANNVAYPPYTTPRHCAPNTGVLVKAVMAHDDSGTRNLLPLLDCVADMQVVYGLDTDANPATDPSWSDDISGLTAVDIRAQLVELHVHILAQVGQRDESYTYPYDNVSVGSEGFGRTFDFTSPGISGFRKYRWKVYSIVVKPKNQAN